MMAVAFRLSFGTLRGPSGPAIAFLEAFDLRP